MKKNDLNTKLLIKRKLNLKIWKMLRLSVLQKMRKFFSEENTKTVYKQPFSKVISLSVNRRHNHPLQQKCYQFELKGM